MRTVTVGKLAEAVWQYVQADTPILISGPTGIGKSDICEHEILDLCNEEFGETILHYIALSHYDKLDLLGLPRYDKETNSTKFAPPSNLLPHEEDGKMHLIIIDEISHSTMDMLHVLYQIILKRTFGPFKMPSRIRLIATGNVRSDRGGDKGLPMPLNNRMAHILVKPDAGAVLDYAAKHNWDISLRSFLTFCQTTDPDAFHNVHESDPAFPTPRSWAELNKFMNNSPDVIEDIASGLVASSWEC